MLVFSKDNTLATFQYHVYILHYIYSEREIQEVPCETGKVRSTAGVLLEGKPLLNQFPSSLRRRNIFFASIQNKLCFIQQLNKNFKKTHSSIDPLGLSITVYSDSYVSEGI